MRKITRKSLDELANTMLVVEKDEKKYYFGGGDDSIILQCVLNGLIANQTANGGSGYFNPNSCKWSYSTLTDTITLGGRTFEIKMTNFTGSSNPLVNCLYGYGRLSAGGVKLNGENASKYKFGNKTSDSLGEIQGLWIYIPESLESYFESYFDFFN